jgi:hypothetical protein
MSFDYLFIIYSCKKYIEKSNLLYNLVNNKIKNCKCYIIYGDRDIQNIYEVIDDKYIILKCGDYYENLCEKSITLFNAVKIGFPNVKGIIKCDDDIFPNLKKINEVLSFIQKKSNNVDINYLGNTSIITEDYYTCYHYGKCNDERYNVPIISQKAFYTSGPLYYLSMKSIIVLTNYTVDYNYFFCEDVMVGYILNEDRIYPYNYKMYYDNIEFYDKGCIQNEKKYKLLFIYLQGGLGNQLFQVSAAYELAKTNNMLPILLYNQNYEKRMTHNKTEDEYMSTIFSYFNYTYVECIDLSKLTVYYEYRCFDYDPCIIMENENYLLHGYFQHKKYINNEVDTLSIFKQDNTCNELLLKYPLLTDSYFIHFRMGDYINLSHIYGFNKDTYYDKAINYILEYDKDAHFYILSDDIETTKMNPILNNINKTFIYEMNTIDSLYFMSLCKKGGICANSTFSGWGAKLNNNPDKIVICPKQWINIDYEYEIPFNCTSTF